MNITSLSSRDLKASMPEFLRDTSMAKALVTERRAEELEQRRVALASIATARRVSAERRPALAADLQKASAALAKAQIVVREAEARARAAFDATQQPRRDVDAIVARHAQMLAVTAPECLEAFVAELQTKLDQIVKTGPREETEIAGKRHAIGGRTSIQTYSNATGFSAVTTAIRVALRSARQLHETVVDDGEAEAAIARLRAAIPFERLAEMRENPSLTTPGVASFTRSTRPQPPSYGGDRAA